MATRHRRWPWLVAGILIGAGLIFFGGRAAVHSAVGRVVARLPIEVAYERVSIASLDTLVLHSVSVERPIDLQLREVSVTVQLDQLRTALAGDPISALTLVSARDVSVADNALGTARVATLTIVPPRADEPWLLSLADGSVTVEIPDADEADPSASIDEVPGRSVAQMLEPILRRATSLAAALPPAHLSLDRVRVQAGEYSAELSGSVSVGGTAAAVGQVQVGDLALPVVADQITGGILSATLAFVLHDETLMDLSGTTVVEALVLDDPRLAEAPVGPVDLTYEFEAELDTRAGFVPARMARAIPGTNVPAPVGAGSEADSQLQGAVTVRRGVLTVNGVSMLFEPRLRGLNAPQGDLPLPTPARVDLAVELETTPVQTVVEAVPEALLGPLAGGRVAGELSWRIELEAPPRLFSWTRWESALALNGFEILELPRDVDVRRLAGSFTHRLPAADGPDPRVRVATPTAMEISEFRAQAIYEPPGPQAQEPAGGGPRWASLEEIAPAMIGAAVTAEDGEFLRHAGVNWLSLLFALEINLAYGEIRIGGSTIPMQLAQNLFLDGQRIVSRKVQELALVALMRQGPEISRARMLELYLNIIEFGPGIYGIVEAARRYFGVAPADLSVEQSVWLASIIRSPRRLFTHARAGAVPDRWLGEMASFMDIMVERGRITPEQRDEAAWRQPGFVEWREGPT